MHILLVPRCRLSAVGRPVTKKASVFSRWDQAVTSNVSVEFHSRIAVRVLFQSIWAFGTLEIRKIRPIWNDVICWKFLRNTDVICSTACPVLYVQSDIKFNCIINRITYIFHTILHKSVNVWWSDKTIRTLIISVKHFHMISHWKTSFCGPIRQIFLILIPDPKSSGLNI